MKITDEMMDWRKVIHVVLLPTAGEPADIIEPAIQAVADSNFPKGQIIILLATEENEPPERRLKKVEYLRGKFDGIFKDFIVTTHKVQDDEMKCKASNATWAARELMKYLDKDFSRDLINKQNLIDETLIKHLENEFSGLTEDLIKQLEDKNVSNKERSFNISPSSLKLSMLRKRLGIFDQECEFKSDPLLKEIFYEAPVVIR